VRNNAVIRPSFLRHGFIRRAFSLVELLVVISIIVLLLAIAVPAFSSMLYSSEQSLAESSLRIALNTARDVAARSPAGQDAAAVFLYDRDSRKTTILICTKAGVIQDQRTDASRAIVMREVFAAAPGVETVQMTAGWAVRGYAPANTIDGEWYGDASFGTYQTSQAQSRGNWVFPETSFFDDIGSTARAQGDKRQTFMVRFEGGTGLVKSPDFAAALVLSPSPGTAFRQSWPPFPSLTPSPIPPWDLVLNNPLNPTHEADQLRFCRRVIEWPTIGPMAAISLQDKRDVLGAKASDTVLAKCVGQVALCSEGRLARALGVRLDAGTGSLYVAPPQPMNSTYAPQLVATVTTDRINEWIENRLLSPDSQLIDSDCRVFTLQRYLGWLQEVTGTSGGLGVGS
jgi:prepilin-type N-terminal cleavage/methylation domain-containing protein